MMNIHQVFLKLEKIDKEHLKICSQEKKKKDDRPTKTGVRNNAQVSFFFFFLSFFSFFLSSFFLSFFHFLSSLFSF